MRALIDSFAASDKTAPRLDNGRLDPFASGLTNGPTPNEPAMGAPCGALAAIDPHIRSIAASAGGSLPNAAELFHLLPRVTQSSCTPSRTPSDSFWVDPASNRTSHLKPIRNLARCDPHRAIEAYQWQGMRPNERIDASMRPPKRLPNPGLGPFESPPSPVAPNDAKVGESGV